VEDRPQVGPTVMGGTMGSSLPDLHVHSSGFTSKLPDSMRDISKSLISLLRYSVSSDIFQNCAARLSQTTSFSQQRGHVALMDANGVRNSWETVEIRLISSVDFDLG
jgi:hypothetical protein